MIFFKVVLQKYYIKKKRNQLIQNKLKVNKREKKGRTKKIGHQINIKN